jgi:hypothetical protein
MTRRILIIIGIVIAFVITVPAGILYYLAYTERGLQLIVRNIPERIGRAQMELTGARGTLAGGFTLQRSSWSTNACTCASMMWSGTSG